MNEGFAKYLLAQITERIHRFKAFLLEASPSCSQSELELVDIYSALLANILEDEIKPSAIALSLLPNSLEVERDDIISVIILELLIVCVELDTLLAAADIFPKLQPRIEAFSFINHLFPTNIYPNTARSIVLWGDYNFAELELREYLIEKIKERLDASNLNTGFTTPVQQRLASLSQRPVVLYLAQLEKNNPLMWVPLAHEIGHAIEEERGITAKVIDGLQPRLNLSLPNSASDLHKLRNWLPELISDEIGLRVLGASYYCALASFSALEPSPLNKASITHPPSWNRLEMLSVHCTNIESRNLMDFYKDLIAQRRLVDDQLFRVARLNLDVIDWQSVYDEVKQQIDLLVGIGTIALDWATCKTLTNRKLRERLPMSKLTSLGDEQLRSINNIAKQIVHRLEELTDEIVPDDDDTIKRLKKQLEDSEDLFKESACKPYEIVGAGWEERKKQIEEFAQKYFGNLQSVPATQQWDELDIRIKNCEEQSDLMDSLLNKSLEIIPVIELLGVGNAIERTPNS